MKKRIVYILLIIITVYIVAMISSLRLNFVIMGLDINNSIEVITDRNLDNEKIKIIKTTTKKNKEPMLVCMEKNKFGFWETFDTSVKYDYPEITFFRKQTEYLLEFNNNNYLKNEILRLYYLGEFNNGVSICKEKVPEKMKAKIICKEDEYFLQLATLNVGEFNNLNVSELIIELNANIYSANIICEVESLRANNKRI